MSKVLFNESVFLPYIKKLIFYRKYLFLFEDSKYLMFFENELNQFCITLKEANQKYQSEYKKYVRAFNRIKLIFNNYEYVYFITCTFSDNYILDYDKCFKKFKRTLSDYCYIANIDYGSTTERTHYHLVLGSSISLTKDILKYKYGFIDIKRANNKNLKALSKYLVKLTNHARKQNLKLIYSRLSK